LLRKTESDFATTEYNYKEVQRHIETASIQLLQATDRNDYATILETNERIVISEKLPKKPDYDNLITVIPKFIIAQHKFKN
jgi:hypothetical protein